MANTFQYWDAGTPIVGSENDTTLTFQYWDGGFPYNYVDAVTSGSLPPAAVSSTYVWAFILG